MGSGAAGRKTLVCATYALFIYCAPRPEGRSRSGLDFDEFNLEFAQGSERALSGINESLWVSFGRLVRSRAADTQRARTPAFGWLYGSFTVNEVERIMIRNLSSVSTTFYHYYRRRSGSQLFAPARTKRLENDFNCRRAARPPSRNGYYTRYQLNTVTLTLILS